MAPTAGTAHTSDTEESPLYGADEFRIYCMKVLPCSKRYCHDWTTCPFAHPGEKARRRDPRVFNYTGIACPDMKKEGTCPRREACPYAHNVFEYWLHPTRYRTQLCNDDNRCKRRICFFAHSLEELRVPSCKPFVPPEALAAATPPDALTDASGNPSDWSRAFGMPKAAGAGAFAGSHTSPALADLQSKLASLQLAVQSTQPGTKLHQDQEMMINILSATLRNAYVINSFSAGASGQGQGQAIPEQPGGSLFSQHQQRQHSSFMPHGESLPSMPVLHQPLHHAQLQQRAASNPETLAWQAHQLRESLAMEYARASMDAGRPVSQADAHHMASADLAYQLSNPVPRHFRSSTSDLSSRMSLSSVSRLSRSDSRVPPLALAPTETPSQATLWADGSLYQQPPQQQQQQQQHGLHQSVLQGSSVQSADPILQNQSGQADPLLQHEWLQPTLPSLKQPYPHCLDSTRQPGTGASPSGRPSPGSSPNSHQAANPLEPTIRASLMDHWQQQQKQPPPQPSTSSAGIPGVSGQHPWAHQVPEAGASRQSDARQPLVPPLGVSVDTASAVPPGLVQHLGMHAEALGMQDVSMRSSSESSRFSMESLRRSVESMSLRRYSERGRTSSNDSSNGRISYGSGSPRMSDAFHNGQESLFAFQPAHSTLGPMASVPEAEPIAAPLPH